VEWFGNGIFKRNQSMKNSSKILTHFYSTPSSKNQVDVKNHRSENQEFNSQQSTLLRKHGITSLKRKLQSSRASSTTFE
jgi:hypothetical protein